MMKSTPPLSPESATQSASKRTSGDGVCAPKSANRATCGDGAFRAWLDGWPDGAATHGSGWPAGGSTTNRTTAPTSNPRRMLSPNSDRGDPDANAWTASGSISVGPSTEARRDQGRKPGCAHLGPT